jgi:hypothetical protein
MPINSKIDKYNSGVLNMIKTYEVDLKGGITIIRFLSIPTIEDLHSAMDEVAVNYLSNLRLWYLDHEGLNFSTEQLISMAEYGKSKFNIKSKVAIVTNNNIEYGLMRQFVAYRSDELSEHMVFDDELEAIYWLKH